MDKLYNAYSVWLYIDAWIFITWIFMSTNIHTYKHRHTPLTHLKRLWNRHHTQYTQVYEMSGLRARTGPQVEQLLPNLVLISDNLKFFI